MFDNKKYATCGVMTKIPAYLQNMLWYMIETMEAEKDYLQVFELTEVTINGVKNQRVVHKQENPYYKKEHIFPTSNSVTAKIFVIDDITHSTMLLAEEY